MTGHNGHRDDMPRDSRGRIRRRLEVPSRFAHGFLAELDQRTALYQELRGRLDALMADLGGADQLSYAQQALCQRAVWLEFWLQREEGKLAQGNEFDVGRWTQACNALAGILGKLGLERRAKPVPHLHDYLQQQAEAKQRQHEAGEAAQ